MLSTALLLLAHLSSSSLACVTRNYNIPVDVVSRNELEYFGGYDGARRPDLSQQYGRVQPKRTRPPTLEPKPPITTEPPRPGTITVPGPKWLSVLCLDDVSSAPVVGAEVVVELPGKPPKKMKATTGENGTASFSLESQGGGGEGGGASVTALISVEADGYLPVQEQVNPEEVGWKITIRLALQRVLVIHVTNNQKSGAAVAGASVTVYISGGDILGPTETDSDGNARFEVGMAGGEEDREATVDVSLPGFSAVTGHAVLIPKGTEEIPTVEIGLDMLTTLDVHCTDRRTGQALSGVEVAVGAAGQGHQTDDKGVVSIQEVFVGQNPVRVVAKRNGYKTVDSTFKLIAGLKRQELHIKMNRLTKVTVTSQDVCAEKAGLKNVQVQLKTPKIEFANELAYLNEEEHEWKEETDAEGKAVFFKENELVVVGDGVNVTFNATIAGYQPNRTKDYLIRKLEPEPEELALSIEMWKETKLTLLVRDRYDNSSIEHIALRATIAFPPPLEDYDSTWLDSDKDGKLVLMAALGGPGQNVTVRAEVNAGESYHAATNSREEELEGCLGEADAEKFTFMLDLKTLIKVTVKDSSGGTVEMSKHNQTNATIYVYPREKGEQGVQLDRDVDREIAENDRLALYFRPDFVTVGNKELTVQVSVDAFGEYQAYKKNHTIQWDKQQGQQSKYTIEINPEPLSPVRVEAAPRSEDGVSVTVSCRDRTSGAILAPCVVDAEGGVSGVTRAKGGAATLFVQRKEKILLHAYYGGYATATKAVRLQQGEDEVETFVDMDVLTHVTAMVTDGSDGGGVVDGADVTMVVLRPAPDAPYARDGEHRPGSLMVDLGKVAVGNRGTDVVVDADHPGGRFRHFRQIFRIPPGQTKHRITVQMRREE